MKKDPMVERAAKEYQAILRRGMKKPKRHVHRWRVAIIKPSPNSTTQFEPFFLCPCLGCPENLSLDKVNSILNRYERLKAEREGRKG